MIGTSGKLHTKNSAGNDDISHLHMTMGIYKDASINRLTIIMNTHNIYMI